jgi:hypothetical protein
VAARDEDALLELLGEDEGSGRATWSVYDGPLHIDVRLPVEFHVDETGSGGPSAAAEVVVDDVSAVEGGLLLGAASGRTAAMMHSVLEEAFPRVHAALAVGPEELTEDALRAAVKHELLRLVEAERPRPSGPRRAASRGVIAGDGTAGIEGPLAGERAPERRPPAREKAAREAKPRAKARPQAKAKPEPRAKTPKRKSR